MTEDNEKKLLETFPDLFITNGLGFPKFGGFDCGDGYFDLVWNLSKDIQQELDGQFGEESRILYVAEVSQERYGCLRFYMNDTTPEINNLIDHAILESHKICDICGKPGKAVGDRWINTRCDEHYRS